MAGERAEPRRPLVNSRPIGKSCVMHSNGSRLLAALTGVWGPRVLWLAIGLAGAWSIGDALDGRSSAVRSTVMVGAWLLWGIGVVAHAWDAYGSDVPTASQIRDEMERLQAHGVGAGILEEVEASQSTGHGSGLPHVRTGGVHGRLRHDGVGAEDRGHGLPARRQALADE